MREGDAGRVSGAGLDSVLEVVAGRDSVRGAGFDSVRAGVDRDSVLAGAVRDSVREGSVRAGLDSVREGVVRVAGVVLDVGTRDSVFAGAVRVSVREAAPDSVRGEAFSAGVALVVLPERVVSRVAAPPLRVAPVAAVVRPPVAGLATARVCGWPPFALANEVRSARAD